MGCPERELASHLGGFDGLAYSPQNLWRFERAFVIHPTSSPGQTPTFIFLLLLGSTFFHYVRRYIHT